MQAGAPWGLAHSQGRSPRFTLKWEKQAQRGPPGSGFIRRLWPHREASPARLWKLALYFRKLLLLVSGSFFLFFPELLLTFHLFSEMASRSPSIDILSNSRKGPPDSQASPQGHPGHFHRLLSVSDS